VLLYRNVKGNALLQSLFSFSSFEMKLDKWKAIVSSEPMRLQVRLDAQTSIVFQSYDCGTGTRHTCDVPDDKIMMN